MALSNEDNLRLEARDKAQYWLNNDQYRGMKPYEPVELPYPASAIGLLIAHFGGDVVKYGTATLIYRNFIITAAQNVYDREGANEARSVVFISSSPDGGEYRSKKITFPQSFKISQTLNRYNFAIIELDQSCHLRLGFLGLSFRTEFPETATLFGYKIKSSRLRQAEEVQIRKEGNLYFAKLQKELEEGDFMPGSPILTYNKWGDDIQIVGIYIKNGEIIHLKNAADTQKAKTLQAPAPSEQIMLCDPQYNVSIVQTLIDSPDRWNRRIFTLGIFNPILGIASPKILNKVKWTTLRTLNLFDCQLTDQNVKNLSMGSFVSLEKLYLTKNSYGIQAVEVICRGSWKDLNELYLWATHTNVLCMPHIIRSFPFLKALEFSESPHQMPTLLNRYAKVGLPFVTLKT